MKIPNKIKKDETNSDIGLKKFMINAKKVNIMTANINCREKDLILLPF